MTTNATNEVGLCTHPPHDVDQLRDLRNNAQQSISSCAQSNERRDTVCDIDPATYHTL